MDKTTTFIYTDFFSGKKGNGVNNIKDVLLKTV